MDGGMDGGMESGMMADSHDTISVPGSAAVPTWICSDLPLPSTFCVS
jgi:hypothetical protein